MTQEITSMNRLNERVKQLEEEVLLKTAILKGQAAELADDLKPSALLKGAVAEIAYTKKLKAGALDTTIGMGAGWLVRKIYQARSKSIFKKLTGFILQNITTGIVTSKAPAIRHKIAQWQQAH